MTDRARIALLLAPAALVTLVLTGCALAIVLARSFGNPASLAPWAAMLADPDFAGALGLSLYVAVTATAISTILGIGAALLLQQRFAGRGAVGFLFQLNLTLPHLIGALGMVYLLGQSGLLARGAFAAGWIDRPAEFPALTHDPAAIAVILTYVWKEVPFIGLIVLAQLQTIGPAPAQAARTLGATRWQAFAHVVWPQIRPAALPAAAITFAFVFGAYEVPLLLGASHPQALPVLAWRGFTDVDLASRPQAMAMAAMIAVICALIVGVWLRLGRRSAP